MSGSFIIGTGHVHITPARSEAPQLGVPPSNMYQQGAGRPGGLQRPKQAAPDHRGDPPNHGPGEGERPAQGSNRPHGPPRMHEDVSVIAHERNATAQRGPMHQRPRVKCGQAVEGITTRRALRRATASNLDGHSLCPTPWSAAGIPAPTHAMERCRQPRHKRDPHAPQDEARHETAAPPQ